MTEADAVAQGMVTGGGSDNPKPATQHNQAEGNGKAAAADWGTVDEVLRKTIEAKGWKAPGDVVKSYVELEKYSSKSVQDMTPEEREKFMKTKLGRPESPDAYELSNVVLPEGMQRSASADKELKEVVWKMQSLPLKEQAKALHEWAMTRAANGLIAAKAAMKERAEKNESELRKEWGLEYEATERRVQSLVRNIGGDAMVQYMNSDAGKEPALRRFLANVAKQFSQDTLETGRVAPAGQQRTGMVVDFSKSPELSTNKRR